MRVARHGFFESLTAEDLLNMVDETTPHPDQMWHFRVESITEYFALALAMQVPELDLLASKRVMVWCPRATAREIRRHHEEVVARHHLTELLAGINPS